jgi:hypothetical protein
VDSVAGTDSLVQFSGLCLSAVETKATAKTAEMKPAPPASNAIMNNLARKMASLNLCIEHPELPLNIRYYSSSHFVQSGEHHFQEYVHQEQTESN